MKKLLQVTGVICPKCQEFIWSKYGHDFRRCTCGSTFVDGGRNYLRYGWDGEKPRVTWRQVSDTPGKGNDRTLDKREPSLARPKPLTKKEIAKMVRQRPFSDTEIRELIKIATEKNKKE